MFPNPHETATEEKRSALAITAYSACNGLGTTTDEVLAALAASRSGLRPPPLPVDFATLCGVVDESLPAVSGRFSAYDSRQARIALTTLDPIRATLDAAIRRWGRERIGLVLATSTGGIAVSEEAHRSLRRTGRVPPDYDFGRRHAFFAWAELIRLVTGVAGPGHVVSTACSSGGKALASARRLIFAEIVDAVLVGGVDSLALTTICGFGGLGVLSAEPCRPFSARRNGMNIGEGGAMLLLERAGQARATLLGTGESSDARN
ncbi:MAG TPA: beta-ketoacyl synthase N-terminal-like domain-containing protein, partial [Candidatus Polarisedimenticolaceae bacterium]|nr:beta-ketoacyl synthase N-terminal-like domain-containing protein [Candidatus Polarisedimenticolaceae bacterium]